MLTQRDLRHCKALLYTFLIAIGFGGQPLVANAQVDEHGRSYEELAQAIDREQAKIDKLEQRRGTSEGVTREAVDSRLMRSRLDLLKLNRAFLKRAVDEKDATKNTAELKRKALEILKGQLAAIETTRGMLEARIVLPEEKMPPAESAVIYNRIFQQIDRLNEVYQAHVDSIELAGRFGLDVADETARLRKNLRERAENGSIFLELTMGEVSALRASLNAVPDDAEIKARLGMMTANIASLSDDINRLLTMMDSLEMDTRDYHNQLLAATGQITSNLFQLDVITDLFVGWGETLWDGLIESGPGLVFKLLVLLFVIYLFYKLSHLARRITERAVDNSQLQFSQLLRRMIISLAGNLVLIVGVLIALAQIGISLGPVLAGMGVVGFIVGFALQDTLANFAAGVLILVYRPFDVDDYIEAGGVSGLVSEMSLVNTTFLTFDNQKIIVPNGKIWGDVIKNVTAQTIRRVDLVFGISYSEDIEKAEKVMAEVVAAHPAVLDEPQTQIRLNELADSSVNFVVRPWVNKDDYWDTYWDLMRAMKVRFDEEGIAIPFPQRDVHLFKASSD